MAHLGRVPYHSRLYNNITQCGIARLLLMMKWKEGKGEKFRLVSSYCQGISPLGLGIPIRRRNANHKGSVDHIVSDIVTASGWIKYVGFWRAKRIRTREETHGQKWSFSAAPVAMCYRLRPAKQICLVIKSDLRVKPNQPTGLQYMQTVKQIRHMKGSSKA